MLGSLLFFVMWKLSFILPWLRQFSSPMNCANHTVSHLWKDGMEPKGSQIPQSLRGHREGRKEGRKERLRNFLLGTVSGRLRLWSSAARATFDSMGDLG